MVLNKTEQHDRLEDLKKILSVMLCLLFIKTLSILLSTIFCNTAKQQLLLL